MRQWRKYEHTLRLKHSDYVVKGKRNLTDKEAKTLLGTVVTVTEKMDGSNTGVYKKGKNIFFQKRGGLADGSHPQYKKFLNEWRWNNYEKIEQLPDDKVYYGELMYCVHTIFYDKLPDFWLMFNVWDLKKDKYLDWRFIEDICDDIGFCHAPHIYSGILTKNDIPAIMPKESQYGPYAEGIVINNYKRQIRGKLVYPKFYKDPSFETHWSSRQVQWNEMISNE